MNYELIKDVLDLLEDFESDNENDRHYDVGVNSFKNWVVKKYGHIYKGGEPDWEGKMLGRSPESVIASLIVHMNRFGKNYFKSAIYFSEFSTQDDVIYLIVLKFSRNMSKMELIKKNVHEKPAGMQIINRLIANGWAEQTASEIDKRSKILKITQKGVQALENVMIKVRQATNIVSGDLTYDEKMELIRILNKLNNFHQPVYARTIDSENLLNEVLKDSKG